MATASEQLLGSISRAVQLLQHTAPFPAYQVSHETLLTEADRYLWRAIDLCQASYSQDPDTERTREPR